MKRSKTVAPVSVSEVSGSAGTWLPPGLRDRVRPSFRVRCRAFLKTSELHEALAAGADPLASEELLWRAQKLVEPKERVGFADSIERIIEDVGRGGMQMTPGPQIVTRSAIKDNRALLRVLAERLRGDRPQGLRGLAMTDLLVRYGDSQLYRARSPLRLKWKLLEILAALDPAVQLPTAAAPFDLGPR